MYEILAFAHFAAKFCTFFFHIFRFILPVDTMGGWIDDEPFVTVNKKEVLVRGAEEFMLTRHVSEDITTNKIPSITMCCTVQILLQSCLNLRNWSY